MQETLERPILIENVSSYLNFNHSTMSEWEFLSAVAQEADCGILLDINNIYVSAFNQGSSLNATSSRCRQSAWCNSTWPVTAITAHTCWTRTTIP
ncbi:MAG TPA: DUF692 family protein [Candidatus Binataceae bacterium]